MGPNNVPKHARAAVEGWYGQDNLPTRLTIVSQTRDKYLGTSAWKVTYTREDGPLICAFVWSTSTDDRYKIAEGADCG